MFRNGNKEQKRKTAIMLAVFGIAIVCICIIGAFAKKRMIAIRKSFAYRRLRRKTVRLMRRIRSLKKKKTGIKAGSTETRNGECRTVQKTEDAYEECSAHYEKSLRR